MSIKIFWPDFSLWVCVTPDAITLGLQDNEGSLILLESMFSYSFLLKCLLNGILFSHQK